MTNKRNTIITVAFVATLVILGGAQALLQEEAQAQAGAAKVAPYFEVDPFWPKPLPNHWITGNAIGVGVDERDHDSHEG